MLHCVITSSATWSLNTIDEIDGLIFLTLFSLMNMKKSSPAAMSMTLLSVSIGRQLNFPASSSSSAWNTYFTAIIHLDLIIHVGVFRYYSIE